MKTPDVVINGERITPSAAFALQCVVDRFCGDMQTMIDKSTSEADKSCWSILHVNIGAVQDVMRIDPKESADESPGK